MNEVDDTVYEILGKDSPSLEGIGIPESMDMLGEETYFSEQVQEVAEVIVPECPEDNLLSDDITPFQENCQGNID